MLQLSKRTAYGLYFLKVLATRPNELVSLREIAQQEILPYRFLAQIATDLKKGGYVMSKEGKKGGFSLAKKPEEINLSQIISCLEEPLALVDCQGEVECPKASACSIKQVWDRVNTQVDEVFTKFSLADFLE